MMGWYFLLHLWYERKMDRELNIDTAAIREWQDIESQIIYNRTEATPYQAIDKLFDYYELLPNANFVDFGCGSGRMAFYVHNRFEIPVTGVELNNLTYTDLLNNKETYLSKNTRQNAPLNLIRDYAEKYTITKEQNTFYIDNQGIYYNTIQINEVIRKIEELIK